MTSRHRVHWRCCGLCHVSLLSGSCVGATSSRLLQMTLTFDANGGGSFMTGDLLTKISHETTSSLSALNLPWYFESEPDPVFYLAGTTDWSPVVSLNATLSTSAPLGLLKITKTKNANFKFHNAVVPSFFFAQSKLQRAPSSSAAPPWAPARCASPSSYKVAARIIGVECMLPCATSCLVTWRFVLARIVPQFLKVCAVGGGGTH